MVLRDTGEVLGARLDLLALERLEDLVEGRVYLLNGNRDCHRDGCGPTLRRVLVEVDVASVDELEAVEEEVDALGVVVANLAVDAILADANASPLVVLVDRREDRLVVVVDDCVGALLYVLVDVDMVDATGHVAERLLDPARVVADAGKSREQLLVGSVRLTFEVAEVQVARATEQRKLTLVFRVENLEARGLSNLVASRTQRVAERTVASLEAGHDLLEAVEVGHEGRRDVVGAERNVDKPAVVEGADVVDERPLEDLEVDLGILENKLVRVADVELVGERRRSEVARLAVDAAEAVVEDLANGPGADPVVLVGIEGAIGGEAPVVAVEVRADQRAAEVLVRSDAPFFVIGEDKWALASLGQLVRLGVAEAEERVVVLAEDGTDGFLDGGAELERLVSIDRVVRGGDDHVGPLVVEHAAALAGEVVAYRLEALGRERAEVGGDVRHGGERGVRWCSKDVCVFRDPRMSFQFYTSLGYFIYFIKIIILSNIIMSDPIDDAYGITYSPIVYNSDIDFSKITNVLLVDAEVQDYNRFVENCNSSTFPIVFSHSSRGQDIVDLLTSRLNNISRIAIVANDNLLENGKQLISNKPYFLESDLTENVTEYSENLQLIINIIKTHNVVNIDYLACYSLNYDIWKTYYSILSRETSVIVGASNDKTGNIKFGGDWTMENTGEDIESIYFTSNITIYQGTLAATTINFSCSLYMNNTSVSWSTDNGVTKNDIVWPCTLSGLITVTFAENLTPITSPGFTISSGNNVTLNGNNHTISLNSLPGTYTGLVDSKSNIATVMNIGVISSGTVLAANAGWVGSSYFLGNIVGCYSTGAINANPSGGIVGSYCGSGGTANIMICYSTGNMEQYSASGIAASYAGNNGTCNISKCFSTGTKSAIYSSGIVGIYAGGNNGNCNIDNCYSTGNMTGYGSSGIASNGAGYTNSVSASCKITNCYVSGNAVHSSSYGIVSDNSGGQGVNTGICTITNCYFSGTIGNINRIYFGASQGSGTSVVNCSDGGTTGIWNDSIASSTNNGVTTGLLVPVTDSVWKKVYPNKAWKIGIFYNSATFDYSNQSDGTLTYTNIFPITSYPNALTVKLLNNGTFYGNATVSITNRSVVLTNISGIYNSYPTYITLNNGATTVDYIDSITYYSVSSVNLSPTTATINITETTQLTATVLPANATDKTVTWSSSNTAIATVDANGLVTGVGPGTATITVTTNSGSFTQTATITVIQPVASVNLSPTTATINTTETTQLTTTVLPADATDKTVTWSSSNTAIATVDASGLVTGVGPGTATITVTTNDGSFTQTATITVIQPVASVNLSPTTATINITETTQLTATVLPANATDKTVTWSSSNTAIATVDANGLVTGVGLGTATITVTTNSGSFTHTTTIIVIRPVTSVSINPKIVNIYINKTAQLTANVLPVNASNKSVIWSSNNTSVARVNSSGLITGAGRGTTTISVTSNNGGFTDICTVTVRILPTGISINPNKVIINTRNTKKLLATVVPSNADDKSVNWTSNNINVASVNTSGVVTGIRPGKATITATTKNNIKSFSIITVLQPVTGISVTEKSATIKIKGTKSLKAIVTPSNASNKAIIWSSSNKKIATVSNSGIVKGVNVGRVTLTVQTVDGSRTATVSINVVK